MISQLEHPESRPVEELIKLWPDTWERFDGVVGGMAMVQDKPDESALKTLITQPVQEMLRVCRLSFCAHIEYLLELSRAEITEETFDDVFKIVCFTCLSLSRADADRDEGRTYSAHPRRACLYRRIFARAIQHSARPVPWYVRLLLATALNYCLLFTSNLQFHCLTILSFLS